MNTSHSFNINESTVKSIKKNEAAIRGSVTASAPASAKTVCQVWNKSLEETESALNIWIEDMNQKQVPLSSGSVQAKVKTILDVHSRWCTIFIIIKFPNK